MPVMWRGARFRSETAALNGEETAAKFGESMNHIWIHDLPIQIVIFHSSVKLPATIDKNTNKPATISMLI